MGRSKNWENYAEQAKGWVDELVSESQKKQSTNIETYLREMTVSELLSTQATIVKIIQSKLAKQKREG